MPPDSSSGSHPDAPHGTTGPTVSTSDAGRSSTADRAQRVRFRRAVTLMVMTLVIPGSAQLVAGNRRIGRIATRVWMTVVVVTLLSAVVSVFAHSFVFWVASNTLLLGVIRLGLMALAVGWALLFMDAWRLGQPLGLQRQQRLAVVGVNGLLSLTVAGALLFGAHMVDVQRQFMLTMFGDGAVVGAHEGRFNVLLLGGDSGAGRWGLRPDSLTVASIDARTGKTVLIGLPRNMANFPFEEGSPMAKAFPGGFDCDGCYLNGVSTWAQDNTELFKGSDNPGVDATVSAVEGITDLDINYYAMVNLAGFRNLVDAVGGVELTVRDRIPVGLPHDSFFRYIEPGTRTLDGMDTLWFARAREGSDDYSRMARQKCVMNAMLQQVSPETALRNFEKIAKAILGDDLDQRAPRRGRPLRRAGPQGQEPEDRDRLAGAAAHLHGRPGHRPRPQHDRRGDRQGRGPGPGTRAGSRARRGRGRGGHRPRDRDRAGTGSRPGRHARRSAVDDGRLARDAQGRVRRQRLRGPRGGLLGGGVRHLGCTP